MQDARYESGLDNSPMYDLPDSVFKNETTHLMGLADVVSIEYYSAKTNIDCRKIFINIYIYIYNLIYIYHSFIRYTGNVFHACTRCICIVKISIYYW